MGEYLGDTPIFQRTMTDRERAEYERFRKETTMPKIEQPKICNFPTEFTNDKKATKKETTMPKTAAKTETKTAEKKETAVKNENTEPKKVSPFAAKKAAATALRDEHIDEVMKAEPMEGVTSCLPGKTIANLTDDPAEAELLARAATFFEMGNEFCTEAQAKKFGGTLNEDESGWLIFWKPKTTKEGKTSTWSSIVYPVDAFEWAGGKPVFDEQAELERKARRAKRAANKAAKELKAANDAAGIKTPRRTVARATANTSADVAAMTETMNALMAQNAQLIAALTAALTK